MAYVVIGAHKEKGTFRVVGSFYQTARADQAVKVLSVAEPNWEFSYSNLEDGVSALQKARKEIRQEKRKQKNAR